MELNSPPTIILKYYAYQATATFGFFWPIYTLFLLERGLDFTEIALLSSISAGFVVVGEIPTGYVADRIGRRNSLVVSAVLFTASIFGFVVAHSFAEFVVLWTLWAFGQTFRSGAGAAWLYETLQDRLDGAQYTRVRGRGGSVNMWVSAGTMLVSGVLFGIDPTLPFVAAGVLNGLGVAVLFTMPATNQFAGGPSEETFSVFDAVPLIRDRLSRPPLRSFVVYVGVFFGVVAAADKFIQPVTVDTVGLPEASLGPLFAAFTAVSAVASYFAGDIEDALSTRWAVLVVPVVTGVVFVVPAFLPIVALPMFFVMKSAQTVMRPIAGGFLNDHADDAARASLLSAASLVYAVFRLVLQPVGGLVADFRSPLLAFAALGGLFLLVAVAVYLVEAPVTEGIATSEPGGGRPP